MTQRQIGEFLVVHSLGLALGEPARIVENVVHGYLDVAMREHRTFGRAGSARRVDEGHHIVRLSRQHQTLHRTGVGRPVCATGIHEIVPEHQTVIIHRPDAPRLRVDDRLDLGERVRAGFNHFVDLLLILSKVDSRPGVVEEVQDF